MITCAMHAHKECKSEEQVLVSGSGWNHSLGSFLSSGLLATPVPLLRIEEYLPRTDWDYVVARIVFFLSLKYFISGHESKPFFVYNSVRNWNKILPKTPAFWNNCIC